MSKEVNKSISSSTEAADPQPVLTPEQVIEQIVALRASIPVVEALSSKERRLAQSATRLSAEVLQAQIDFLAASDVVQGAVAHGADEARQMAVDDDRWAGVERELKILLDGIAGANLRRREKLHGVAAQAYSIGTSLSKTPLHAELAGRVNEVRRLRRAARRKKASPQAPAPAGSGNATM
jgi:hypothetical protein